MKQLFRTNTIIIYFVICTCERKMKHISKSILGVVLHGFLFGKTRLGKGSFQIEVLTLVQLMTENRLRHARGPVHSYFESVT